MKGPKQYITYFDATLQAFGVRVGKRRKTFVCTRGEKRERLAIGWLSLFTRGMTAVQAKPTTLARFQRSSHRNL